MTNDTACPENAEETTTEEQQQQPQPQEELKEEENSAQSHNLYDTVNDQVEHPKEHNDVAAITVNASIEAIERELDEQHGDDEQFGRVIEDEDEAEEEEEEEAVEEEVYEVEDEEYLNGLNLPDDIVDEIYKLKEMLSNQFMSPEEYLEARDELLAPFVAPSSADQAPPAAPTTQATLAEDQSEQVAPQQASTTKTLQELLLEKKNRLKAKEEQKPLAPALPSNETSGDPPSLDTILTKKSSLKKVKQKEEDLWKNVF